MARASDGALPWSAMSEAPRPQSPARAGTPRAPAPAGACGGARFIPREEFPWVIMMNRAMGNDETVAETDAVRDAARELYTSDPADFTGRRAALAAGARSSGDAPSARAIAALRKPTRSAWVVNRLVRADPDVPSRLAALGSDLRAAEEALDGRRIRELSQQRRELIRELTRQALAEAGQRSAPASLQEEVSATLDAALADPQVARDLAEGRLLRAVERAGFGFGDASGFGEASGPGEGSGSGEAAFGGLTAVPDGATTGRRERGERTGAGQPPAGRAKTAGGARTAGGAGTVGGGKAAGQTRADRARAAEQAKAERERAEQARAAERERAEAERARAEEQRRREALDAARRAVAEADQAAEEAEAAERDSAEAVEDLQRQLGEAYKRQADARRQVRQAAVAQRNAHRVLDRLDE